MHTDMQWTAMRYVVRLCQWCASEDSQLITGGVGRWNRSVGRQGGGTLPQRFQPVSPELVPKNKKFPKPEVVIF